MLLCTQANGQTESFVNLNSLDVELYAFPPLYQISYSRLVPMTEKHKMSFGLGIGHVIHELKFEETAFTITPQWNFLYGLKHHIELGIGGVIVPEYRESFLVLRIGYRFQKPQSRYLFKFGLNNMYMPDFLGSPMIIPIPTAGFGFRF